MKQFDPKAGWSDPKSSRSPANVPELSESIEPKPADVYHFNRHGKRLSINANDGLDDDLAFDKTAETADLILQLFDRLEQVDKTKEVLLRLSSSLQTLDTLHEKEHELANQLQATRQEIESLKEQIQSDMQSAQEVEDTNLKIRKYRKALLSKLAGQLAPTAQKAG
jgi:predicted ribosome quality control (RQC) complex YloA/Tae2 family protein